MTGYVEFLCSFRNYESFDSEYFVREVPRRMSRKIVAKICEYALDDDEYPLQKICYKAAALVSRPLSGSPNYGDLAEELYTNVGLLEKNLPGFMDFIAWLVIEDHKLATIVKQTFQSESFGYYLSFESLDYEWKLCEESVNQAKPLEAAINAVVDVCTSTFNHLKQAESKLLNANTNFERAEILRSAIDALESFGQKITNTQNLKAAFAFMRENPEQWGPRWITIDAERVWDSLQKHHPSIRHGRPDETTISREEAFYWLGRMSLLITYLSSVYKNFQ